MLALQDYPCFYFDGAVKLNEVLPLSETEAHHAQYVLRLEIGKEIYVSNGAGILALSTIRELSKKQVLFRVEEVTIHEPECPFSIELAIPPLKNKDRLNWLIEKAVEVGCRKLHLVKTARSVSHKFTLEKFEKTAISALKQSRKAWKTELIYHDSVEDLIQATATISSKLVASYVDEFPPHLKSFVQNRSSILAIGPEGDFTSDELSLFKKGEFEQCSLGKERLRAETAAIYGLICFHSIIA